jgi:transforming growth factor-beta-induced protein
MKKLILFLAFTITGVITFISCDNDDDTMEMTLPTQNLVQIAQANGFNSLAAALTRADLVDALQGNGFLTVFAPTDAAFDNLLTAIGQTSIDDVPVEILQSILKYHVISGKVFSTGIAAGDVTTLSQEDFTISTSDGIKVNGSSVVSPFDVEASNGIVHTIDEVLVPPSIAPFVNSVLEPAIFNKDFSKLVEAVVKADLVETLLTTPNLTIFAPNNDAFDASGINPSALDAEVLASVLTYHVVGAKVTSSGIPSEATTVNGNKLDFSLTSSGNFINGNTEIIAVDIESGSGVVHVIDMVLLPPTGNIVETAVELSGSGEFTSLVAALVRTANEGTPEQNLLTVLSGDGPFTVFAPTNAAFEAALDSQPGWNSLNDIPLETLIDILTYHVVPAKAYDVDLAGALDPNSQLPTANGENMTIDLENLMIDGTAGIIGVNNNTTNGVIHVIDNVLIPSNIVIEPTLNIVELAVHAGFNSLAAALTRADLLGALQGSEPLTVFAPTDAAFADLLAAIGQTSIDDIPVSVLTDILLYHVVEGSVASSMVSDGEVPTLSDENISLTTSNGIQVNGANVVNPFDAYATNGIIHTIDQVLVPSTITPFVNSVLEPAFFNVNFSTLIEAAVKAGVVETLLTTPNLTIFAPTNDAFEASNIDPGAIDAGTLASVLTYHVVGSKVLSSGIPAEAPTVNGNNLNFSLTGSGNYINGNTEIIAVDIESGSGVVHVIDSVLLPPLGNIVETAVDLTTSGEFTSLVAALQRTANEGTAEQNLLTVLSGNGPFTVFAPTNAAFQALLDSNNEWSSLGDIPLDTLIAVLTYHVVPARAYSVDLAGAVDGNNQLPTANGAMLTFDLTNLMINGDTGIIGVNTNATNGVIHVINKVLLP